MKKKTYAVIALVVGIFLMASPVLAMNGSNVMLQATQDPRTPPPSPTPITVQDQTNINFACPAQGNPAGYGTVTPAAVWLAACGQCMPSPTAFPTYDFNQGLTGTPGAVVGTPTGQGYIPPAVLTANAALTPTSTPPPTHTPVNDVFQCIDTKNELGNTVGSCSTGGTYLRFMFQYNGGVGSSGKVYQVTGRYKFIQDLPNNTVLHTRWNLSAGVFGDGSATWLNTAVNYYRYKLLSDTSALYNVQGTGVKDSLSPYYYQDDRLLDPNLTQIMSVYFDQHPSYAERVQSAQIVGTYEIWIGDYPGATQTPTPTTTPDSGVSGGGYEGGMSGGVCLVILDEQAVQDVNMRIFEPTGVRMCNDIPYWDLGSAAPDWFLNIVQPLLPDFYTFLTSHYFPASTVCFVEYKPSSNMFLGVAVPMVGLISAMLGVWFLRKVTSKGA